MECFQHLLLGSCLVGAMGPPTARSNLFPLRVEPYKKTCSYEVRMESFRVHRSMFSWEMVEICGGKKGIAVFAGGQTRSLV